MPADSSVYAQFRPVDFGAAIERGMNLRQMSMQQKQAKQQQQLAMQDRERAMAEQQALKGAYAKAMGPDGKFNRGMYINELGSINPKMAIETEKTYADIDAAKAKRTARDPLETMMAREDYKQRMDQEKKDRELRRYTNVGGWQLKEGATPTPDDAKKFKAGVSATSALLDNLNKYQDLVTDKGSEYFGKNARDMDSLARAIQLDAKNEDLFGLGVLTGPDLALLEELIQAPTGLGSQLNPMAGTTAANKAQQLREIINSRLGAKAKTYGFQPQSDWTQLAENVKGGNLKRDVGPGMGTTRINASDAPKQSLRQSGAKVGKDEVLQYATKYGMKASEAAEYLKGQGYAVD